MTIVLTGDKNVISLLPPEDAKQVLLALFSEDDDLPEMTPLANMAYTSICKGNRSLNTKPANVKTGYAHESKQNDVYPFHNPGASVNHDGMEKNAGLHEQRFDEFWKAYPRKVGKEAARKAWRRIKSSEEHFTKILLAIEMAKNSSQWQKDNGQYIPNPATWLNQGRWDDEIPPASAKLQIKKITNRGGFNQREYSAEDLEKFITSDFGHGF